MRRSLLPLLVFAAACAVAAALWLASPAPLPPAANAPAVSPDTPRVTGALWAAGGIPSGAEHLDRTPAPPPAATPHPADHRPPDASRAPADECLAVAVSQDGLPAPGALVTVWAVKESHDPAVEPASTPLATAATDRDGCVTFAPVRGHVLVVAQQGGARQHAVVAQPRGGRRCAFAFGDGMLTGSVHDAHGAPRGGAVVRASRRLSQYEHDPPNIAHSSVDGAFAMPGLLTGTFDVRCDGNSELAAQRQVTLAAGGRAHVQFGATPGARHWRGAVVDTAGQSVRGGRFVQFAGPDGGERRLIWSAPDGSFDAQLPTGWWLARVPFDALGREQPFAARLALAGTDRALDLVVPGHRVLCRLVAGSAKVQVRMAEMSVFLELDGKRLVTRPPFCWQGEWWLQWLGLPPGRCTLRSVGPASVPALANGLSLVLQPGQPLLQLDVIVQ